MLYSQIRQLTQIPLDALNLKWMKGGKKGGRNGKRKIE